MFKQITSYKIFDYFGGSSQQDWNNISKNRKISIQTFQTVYSRNESSLEATWSHRESPFTTSYRSHEDNGRPHLERAQRKWWSDNQSEALFLFTCPALSSACRAHVLLVKSWMCETVKKVSSLAVLIAICVDLLKNALIFILKLLSSHPVGKRSFFRNKTCRFFKTQF